MRFKDCKLVCYNKAAGIRVLMRLPYVEQSVIGPSNVFHRAIYLVQKRYKLLGIGYWKTILKTPYELVAKDAFYYFTTTK